MLPTIGGVMKVHNTGVVYLVVLYSAITSATLSVRLPILLIV